MDIDQTPDPPLSKQVGRYEFYPYDDQSVIHISAEIDELKQELAVLRARLDVMERKVGNGWFARLMNRK